MNKYFFTALISSTIVVLDVFTKYLIVQKIQLWEAVPVIDNFFQLVFYTNKGAAFGFLNNDSSWQIYLFIAITLFALAVIANMIKTTAKEDKMFLAALALIMGGAIGNLIDRICYGYVVDFLDFSFFGTHFPAFNIADSAITIGAILIIIKYCLPFRKKTT